MCLADRDLQASSRFAARIAARMPAVKVLRYPAGHFDVYLDPLFPEISNAEADFLEASLRIRPRARDTDDAPASGRPASSVDAMN